MLRLALVMAGACVIARAATREDLIAGQISEESLLHAGRTFAYVRALEADALREPANAQIHGSLALGYFLLRQSRFCREELQRALALDPRSIQANYIAGRIAMELEHDYPEAISHFRVVLSVAGDNFKARYFLGICLRNLGRNAEALREFRLASLNATYDWPFAAIAEEELDAGHAQAALDAALKAERINSTAENLVLAGKSWQAVGNDAKALDCFVNAVKLDPSWDAPHYLLGRLYAKLPGKTAEAEHENALFATLRDAAQ
jgi:tetratricopeptide (TPR) repeat protein